MKRADDEAIKQDMMLDEEMVQDLKQDPKEELFEGPQFMDVPATSEGVPVTVALLALAEEL